MSLVEVKFLLLVILIYFLKALQNFAVGPLVFFYMYGTSKTSVLFTRHERTYSGEKPFMCSTFKKRFSLLGNLNSEWLMIFCSHV